MLLLVAPHHTRGLESLSDELRKFDNLPTEASPGLKQDIAAKTKMEDTSSSIVKTSDSTDHLEKELQDLDAELALLGEEELGDQDEIDDPGDLDDAEFAELEKHFDSLS